MKQFFTSVLLFTSMIASAQIGWMSTFESFKLDGQDTFWNGSDESGGFFNGNAFFKNSYNINWKSWKGFSVSNTKDSTTEGYGNQYSVMRAVGANYTGQYAVAGGHGLVTLSKPQTVSGCYITNSTYTTLSMRKGDQFAKKFGGDDGNDADYFRVIATGYNGVAMTRDTFYLADYRFADNSKDYIVDRWKYFDLSKLGQVDSILFTMESSDTGQHGMNTPAYFCLDNFNAPKPSKDTKGLDFENAGLAVDSSENGDSHDGGFLFDEFFFVNKYNKQWKSWSGWAVSATTDTTDGTYTNDKSSITGKGANKSKTYMTGFGRASILFPHTAEKFPETATENTYACAISNATYPYKSMKDGDQFAKKFGGETGNDKDFLVLKISGVDYDGNALDTVEHYLADYRFDDNSVDYISKSWEWVNLKEVVANKAVSRMDFWLEGSDTGQYGLNTPAYFCVDQFLMMNDFASVWKRPAITMGLYPNPASNNLYLDLTATVDKIRIVDLAGKVCLTQESSNHYINVSDLTPGIYSVIADTDSGQVIGKFVKQ